MNLARWDKLEITEEKLLYRRYCLRPILQAGMSTVRHLNWVCRSLTEARVVINQWLEEYNTVRPHGSLGGMNPEKFLQCWSEVNLNQQPETLTG